MHKLKLRSEGFGALIVLVAITLIGLISLAIFYIVREHNHSTESSKSNHVSVAPVIKKTSSAQASPNANWTTYTNKAMGVSIKHPKGWVISTGNGCPDDLILIGANATSLGSCAKNDFGQMAITSQTENLECGYGNTYWTTTSSELITIAGMPATKTDATALVGAGEPEGTKSVQYCLVSNGIKYVASYSQLVSYPNALSDFELMMADTFTIN